MKNFRRMEKESDILQRNLQLISENAELKLKLEEYEWQYDEIHKQEQEIKSLHENTRKLKHDMRNHMMVIASLLNEGDIEAAKDYTSAIMDRLDAVQSYIETGNTFMNAIINEKFTYARNHNIDIKAEINKVVFGGMKSIDFSAVLTNLLDNAIEASEKEEIQELHVRVFQKRGYDAISIRNRISTSVLSNNPQLSSRKEEKAHHGFGVKQVKSIVASYNGLCDFYEEDSFFCVNIFIPQ